MTLLTLMLTLLGAVFLFISLLCFIDSCTFHIVDFIWITKLPDKDNTEASERAEQSNNYSALFFAFGLVTWLTVIVLNHLLL